MVKERRLPFNSLRSTALWKGKINWMKIFRKKMKQRSLRRWRWRIVLFGVGHIKPVYKLRPKSMTPSINWNTTFWYTGHVLIFQSATLWHEHGRLSGSTRREQTVLYSNRFTMTCLFNGWTRTMVCWIIWEDDMD